MPFLPGTLRLCRIIEVVYNELELGSMSRLNRSKNISEDVTEFLQIWMMVLENGVTPSITLEVYAYG